MADPITLSVAFAAIGQAVAVEVAWTVAANYAISTLAFDVILYSTAAAISTIGTAAFAPGSPGVEGPRQDENRTQFSTYGRFIPIPYGRTKSAGNVIWTSGLREVKTSESVGGKGGGGGQTVTTYTYYSSWALGLCEGKVRDIHKIWFDSDLVYDSDSGNDSPIPNFTDKVTFYYGDEDQEPDPIIQAQKGVDQTPAYRGLCYIVFNDMELTDWGNRIPNINVEFSRFPDVGVTSEIYPIEYLEGIDDGYTSFAAYTIGDIFVKNFFQNYTAPNEDRIAGSSQVLSSELRTLLKDYVAPNEDRIAGSSQVLSSELRTLLKDYTAPNEDRIAGSSQIVSSELRVLLLTTTTLPDSFTSGGSIMGASLT
jgi:hypothetical protein